jgi:hypothetical protein
MKNFKFLNKNEKYYDGDYSQIAVRLVAEYVAGRYQSGHRLTTDGACFVLERTTYDRGQIAGAIVCVYPISRPQVKITFWISIGNVYPFITDHSIDINHHEI